MKKIMFVVLLAVVLGFSGLAHAALIDNGNHLIYDTDLHITYYDAPASLRSWSDSTAWAAGLTIGNTVAGSWRLPTGTGNTWSYAGEMGHLYHIELGNTYDPMNPSTYYNRGPFTNMVPYDYGNIYWLSNTAVSSNHDKLAWLFSFPDGALAMQTQDRLFSAMAVHDGNIVGAPSSVPIPPTIWLLGSGLIGLVGLRRRFTK